MTPYTIILHRKREDLNATLGQLELPGPIFKFFHTLEPLPSIIPLGIFPLRFEYSAKFKRFLWELKDTPNHRELKIHNGNTAEDTQGCILIGARHGALNGQPAVLSSRLSLQQFHAAMIPHERSGARIEVIDELYE